MVDMEIYTLLVEVGRIEGDDLPDQATGAAFLLFAPNKEERLAVSDTVQLLRDAGLNPLEVTNYGTIDQRQSDGHAFSEAEQKLLEEVAESGATIIIDKTVFYDEDDDGKRH